MKTYTKKERNMYLIGLAGQNIIYNVIGTGMAYYFQHVLFLPAIAISVIMAIARIWDAINDPMMGTIADRTRTKYGKMRPYLMVVPGVVMITTLLTFCNAQITADTTKTGEFFIIAWAGISYILWGMSYTAGDIPLWGIISLMTESKKDRDNLLALARIVAGVGGGIALAGILPVSQAIGRYFQENHGMTANRGLYWGCIVGAVIFTVLGTALFQCAAYAKEHVKQPSDKKYTFKQTFQIMWACKPFRRILISGVIRSPMNILSLVAMTLLTYYFGDNGGDGQNYVKYLVILGGGMFAGMFIAMGFTPKLCEKFERKTLHNVCCVISAIPFFGIFVLYLIDGTALYETKWLIPLAILFCIAGAGTGAMNVIQSIMIADCVDYEEYHSGSRPDGVFFSGQSFITKLGAGMSSIIQGIVYAVVGFEKEAMEACNAAIMASPKTDFMFATAPEFEPYRAGLFFLVSIPSAIGLFFCIFPMIKYELTNKEHKRILDSLNKKRSEDRGE
ncbi:MAG TPA: hypothetical protein GXZ23_01510 [Clostridiales bacterium]|nr:hypothetical protein [Clostridiales bacterium]